MHVVVDASLLVEVIVAPDDDASRWLRDLLDGDDLYWVPGLTPLEVASALRKLVARGQVDADLASEGLRWLSALLVKHTPIGQSEMARIWELRDSVTPYDAAYLALTERVQAETGGQACLATADGKLARSPAVRCPVELYGPVG